MSFNFLRTAVKDVGKAAKATKKVASKGLNFVEHLPGDAATAGSAIVHHPVQAVTSAAKGIVQGPAGLLDTDIVIPTRQAAARLSHNKVAMVNSEKDAQKQDTLAKVVGNSVQTVSNLTGAGVVKDVATGSKVAKDLGNLDKLKKAVTDTAKITSTSAKIGAAQSAGSQLSDKGSVNVPQTVRDSFIAALAGGGGKVTADAAKAAPALAKALDAHTDDIASKHKSVTAYDDAMQHNIQLREQAVKNNAPASRIKSIDDAYKQLITLRQKTLKSVKEGGYVGFKNSLTGEPNGENLDDMEASGGSIAAKTPAVDKFKNAITEPTPEAGYTPPKSTAQVANDALPGKAKLDEGVVNLLGKTGKASDAASSAPVLEGARDPQSVLSRHFGKTGSDIAYESAQAAKKRSDLQETANNFLSEMDKTYKKTAKTAVGRKDVASRIDQALNDRANADSYLKTSEEKSAYEATQKFYDYYKTQAEKAGIKTRENYSPRVLLKDAQAAAEGLDYNVNKAFSKNVEAGNLKERTAEEPDQELLNDPIAVAHAYSSAVSKHLAYKDTVDKIPERLKEINPVYLSDQGSKQQGMAYLQKYLKDQLQPDIPTNGKGIGKIIGEKNQNKILNRTYGAALTLSPKFGIMNRTQGYATQSQISKEARKLVHDGIIRKIFQVKGKSIDKEDLKTLRGDLTTGDNPISGEALTTPGNIGGSKTKLQKVQAKVSGEKGNVNHAFDSGVAQHLVTSPIYKQAVKDGKKPAEAAKIALADPATKELALRAGNIVTNTTQFGGNIANKPEWLRDTGTVLGISKKWYQQYQRFPLGMTQLLGNVTNPKNARAIDIMRRGNPQETKLVDYLKATKTLQNALPDAKKAIKAGESNGITMKQYQASKDLLDKSVKTLNQEIKKVSQIRGPKTAKNVVKMWAAASVIQYLFTGATNGNSDKTTSQKVGQAIKYGAPVNIPTKDQNPLIPSIPASPIGAHGINKRKLLNFVPIVGPVVNRGREVKGLIEALTGSGSSK